MPLPSYYNAGTATATNASATVTGQSTAWSSMVRAGDMFLGADGRSIRIASVDSDTQLTLALAWPGTSQVAGSYEIRITPAAAEITATVRELLETLGTFTPFGLEVLQGSADAAEARDVLEAASQADYNALATTVEEDSTAINAMVPVAYERPAKRRNYLRNPFFEIAQRGVGPFTAVGMTVDGWQLSAVGTGATGTSVLKSSPNAVAHPYGRRGLLAWNRTAGTTLARMQQKIEGVHLLSGKEVTLALLIYDALGAHDISTRVDQIFGTGGSPSADVNHTAKTHSVTANAQLLFHKMTLSDIAAKTIGSNNDDHLLVIIDSKASGAFQLRLIAAGLFEGDATAELNPFEDRPLAEELAICQRYYEVDAGNNCHFSGNVTSGIAYFYGQEFKVQKRVAPTLALTNAFAQYFPTAAGTSFSSISGMRESRVANVTASGGYFRSTWTATDPVFG